MTGFSSPDVPAYVCYLLIAVAGGIVAVNTINALLLLAENRWAFAGTWVLFFAYTTLPIVLFWFLDYTGAVHDTALFAALVVGFGYRQIFAGGVQGISMAGQTAALWKPFEAWVNQVSTRIGSRNKLYMDQFAEKVKSATAAKPSQLEKFESIVFANTDNVAGLTAAVAPAAGTGHPNADTRRRVDVLWADLRRNRPELYGWILMRNGVVGPLRYWLWLDKGRAKLMSFAAIVLVLAGVAGLFWWFAGAPSSVDRTYSWRLRYQTWRFLKANATERDRWRSHEHLARELSGWGSEKVSPLPDAVTRLNDAFTQARATQDKTATFALGSPARTQAEAAALNAERALQAAGDLARRAFVASVALPRLLEELRYRDIANAKAGQILELLVSCHSPALNATYVPELIESLRAQNEVVRLETRKALVALNVDYPKVTIKDALAKWEPKKNDTPADIDQRVREWRAWWSDAHGRAIGSP